MAAQNWAACAPATRNAPPRTARRARGDRGAGGAPACPGAGAAPALAPAAVNAAAVAATRQAIAVVILATCRGVRTVFSFRRVAARGCRDAAVQEVRRRRHGGRPRWQA